MDQTPETQEKMEKVITAQCKGCGSVMTYSAEKQLLECNHCGASRELPKASDMVVENNFTEALKLEDQPTGLGTVTKVFNCNGCGSQIAVEPSVVSIQCPFCDSKNVNEDAKETKVITPAGILPFKVNKKSATAKFKEWIGKGFFAPSNLKKLARLDLINGVYLPFWTYDADTFSNWTADAGYYYYVTETYTDSNGQVKTRQVRKTRWVPASGYYEHWFDDVLVVGSNGVKQNMVEKIYPFTLTEIVNYDSHYILGWESEIYQKDVKEGYKVADGIMDKYIRSECAKRIPGDTYRNLNVYSRKSGITFKHVLLPVWIAAYHYKGKVFQFLVNGDTGKIAGKKPVSFWKVAGVVLLVLAIIATIWYFASDK